MVCQSWHRQSRAAHVLRVAALKEIDLDSNNHVSFIEFALYKYKFSVAQVRKSYYWLQINICTLAHAR